MSTHHTVPARGSDRTPSFGHARVEDVMRPEIISCGPETDLITAARIMSGDHIHAIVVSGIEVSRGGGEHLTWGLITALDLVSAALLAGETADVGALATTEVVTVDAGESLEQAAQLMVEHQLTHLIVVSAARPVGVISTLDVAGCLAWGEG